MEPKVPIVTTDDNYDEHLAIIESHMNITLTPEKRVWFDELVASVELYEDFDEDDDEDWYEDEDSDYEG